MRPTFFRRIKRAVKGEFRRIREEHRSTGHRRRRPSFSARLRRWIRSIREQGIRAKPKRHTRPHMPPLTKRIGYFLRGQRDRYRIVFSSGYLIIALNSTVLFLTSFFLVHFLTHFVTGIAAYSCEISTTLNYTMVDFHIRYWDWTPEMVIIVFSVPALFAVFLALAASRVFARKGQGGRSWLFNRLRYFTRKQRHRHKREMRKREIEKQVVRLQTGTEEEKPLKHRKRIPWMVRLFFLWTMYHSLTYFFSGMLYAFLFHRRFGYVIWYAFDSFFFDLLFSLLAFLLMLAIGYIFAVQFFYSGRMYLNKLNDANRMPFMVSQVFIPFFIGTVVTIALQIPVFDPSLILLNFSLFFLLLPIPSRAARFDSLHFDNHEKRAKIQWNWIVGAIVVALAIMIAVKTGIPITLPR